jgi:hypothetical protein
MGTKPFNTIDKVDELKLLWTLYTSSRNNSCERLPMRSNPLQQLILSNLPEVIMSSTRKCPAQR